MRTSINYTAITPNLELEKAFSTDYHVDHIKGAVRSNTKTEYHPVSVNEIQEPEKFQLDVHGFCVLHGKTHLDPLNAYKNKSEVEKAYCVYNIITVTSKVRKRDIDYPEVVRAYRTEYEQPSSLAHCDWSTAGALTVLRWCFPGNENFWKGKRFDLLNVWRPLKQPSDDWPLAVCDYTTVDPEHDIRLNDAIRRDRIDELCLLHYNEKHKWYYLKDQGVDDLLVFRNTDSHGDKARAFHAAVRNPLAKGPPRESVEVRLVAIY
ncbi:uncharacterized protein PG998_010184 [Apiospora kogelbergensis]|uniref:uncharacterized protein n=1 Tax=Apiospora kogelbergensis TaxID=1337665 RepID=UPI00312DB244